MADLKDDLKGGFIAGPKQEDVNNVLVRQREQLISNIKMAAIVEAQKADMELLSSTEAYIERLKNGDVEKKDSRDFYETPYSLKMQILYSMARRFHPRSSFGMKMIGEAKKTREEFEERIGTYTTAITEDNVSFFSGVLTEDMTEDIMVKKSYGLGAVRSDEDTTFGAGAMVYDLTDAPGGGVDIRVRWLYVHERFRGKGVVHSLLGELIGTLSDGRIDSITVDMSLAGDWLVILGFILNSWMFEFGTGLLTEALIRVGDIDQPGRFAVGAKDVECLAEANDAVAIRRGYFEKTGYSGYMSGVPEDYLDAKLSCYVGTAEEPVGLLLAHCMPSKRIRIDYLEGDDDKAGLSLLCHVFMQLSGDYPGDTEIIFPISSTNLGRALDKLIPKQQGLYMVEGILTRPPLDTDVSDVERMLGASEEELKNRDKEDDLSELLNELSL